MVALDHHPLRDEKSSWSFASADSQVACLILITSGAIGGALTAGLLGLLLGPLPGWAWFAILAANIALSIFLAGVFSLQRSHPSEYVQVGLEKQGWVSGD
jgi:hypothetical protein